MSSVWSNRNLKLTIFGESHGSGIGVVLDGIPGGTIIDLEEMQRFMQRRAPGRTSTSTQRKEADLPEILSGVLPGEDGKVVACGTPIAAVIRNTDAKSKDYSNLSTVARPGHADYTGYLRYNGCNDPRGGGHFSARLTAPLVFAGGICKQLLAQKGVQIGAHVLQIGGVKDAAIDPVSPDPAMFDVIAAKTMPVINDKAGQKMIETIDAARMDQNSVGGIVECAITGMPAGIGDPMFGGIENVLSSILYGIPAVKGVSFGDGFDYAEMTGAQANDPFCMDGDVVRTLTNHAGGILGGITTGMPILFRAAFKPTPSIARAQQTVDFQKNTETVLEIHGRHDPCVVPRAVPCVEAAAAIAMASFLIK